MKGGKWERIMTEEQTEEKREEKENGEKLNKICESKRDEQEEKVK